MNNGVLHWNKRQLSHSWWNDFDQPHTSGGNLYYRIPYSLDYYDSYITQEMIDDIEKIVDWLFKRNPDYIDCHISMMSLGNKGTTSEYVTACVVTEDREFYDKYKSPNRVPL